MAQTDRIVKDLDSYDAGKHVVREKLCKALGVLKRRAQEAEAQADLHAGEHILGGIADRGKAAGYNDAVEFLVKTFEFTWKKEDA